MVTEAVDSEAATLFLPYNLMMLLDIQDLL